MQIFLGGGFTPTSVVNLDIKAFDERDYTVINYRALFELWQQCFFRTAVWMCGAMSETELSAQAGCGRLQSPSERETLAPTPTGRVAKWRFWNRRCA